MLSEFSFHTNLGSGPIQLYPINDDLVFADKQDSDFGFYRRTLETELIFKGNSYNDLYAIEIQDLCVQFDVDIKYKGQAFYTGILKFRTSNMKWDLDKCRVNVKLDPQDEYTCLLDNWEREFNAMRVIYGRENVGFLAGTIEETTCVHNEQTDGPYGDYTVFVEDCIPSGEGWTAVEHRVQNNLTPGFFTASTKYQREVITLACVGGSPPSPPGDGWVLTNNNCPTDATFARAIQVQLDVANSFDLGSGVPGELFYLQVYDAIGINAGVDIGTVSNAIMLNDVIGNEFTVLNCKGLAIRSNLLNLNPQGSSPNTKPYTEPRTHELVFFQKTDITTYAAGQDAFFHLWSFKRIMEALVAMYDAQIRIVGNTLRIEHRTYFDGTNDLDLTSPLYERYIEGFYQYEYETIQMPRKETWKYREVVSTQYMGSPIIYDCYANNDSQETVFDIPEVTNDIGFMLGNPTLVSKDGFVIAETAVVGSDRIFVGRLIYGTNLIAINGAHSIPSLIDHYWRWERPNITGLMNDITETFNTTIRRKKQTQLNIKMDTETYRDLVPDNLVRTQIGWGKVQEYSWSARSCKLTINVYH